MFSFFFLENKTRYSNVSLITGDKEVTAEPGGNPVEWKVFVDVHPKPTLTWCNPKGENITSKKQNLMTKYEVEFPYRAAILRIFHINQKDHGIYVLKIKNRFEENEVSLSLKVKGKFLSFRCKMKGQKSGANI